MNNENENKNNIQKTINTNTLLLNENCNQIADKEIKIITNEEEKYLKKVLEDDETIKDLRTNPNSKLRNFFSSIIIKRLVSYCLNPEENFNKDNKNSLRYTYYSCLLLCSQCCLLFSKSMPFIKEANNKNKQEIEDNKGNNNNNNNNNNNYFSIDNYLFNKSQENDYINFASDDLFEITEAIHSEKQEIKFLDEFFNFNDYSEIEEKYVQMTETEVNKITIKEKSNEYNEEEKNIINDILNEIFKIFNCKNFRYNDEETYMGYFQKIINYLIIYETDIIIDYLFKEPQPKINRLYEYLDKAAIAQILENLLNALGDKKNEEINMVNSKYKIIIINLLNELTKDINYEKAGFICELIINTLLNNNEKFLIELIFNNKEDNNMIIQLYKYIQKLINKDNINNKVNNGENEKIIINLIKMLCQLNNIIMKSFYESSYFKNNNNINLFIEDNKKINTFEYQYIPKKNISYQKLFETYQNNIDSYLKMMNDIYYLIKEDIIEKYRLKKYNNNIVTNNNNKNNIFGYLHLYEWKFIANVLKFYIYSFYAVKNTNNLKIEYFNFQDLFPTFIELYFEYSQNNIYQNIFTDIIRLMCEEICPKYLNKPLLNKDKTNEENIFIFKIINNLKKEINNKYNLLLGSNIEVLKIFYSSFNPAILKHFKKSKLDNIIKDTFIQSINPNIERKLLDDYDYSFSEIFNSYNELNDTFDGNDSEIQRKKYSLKEIIEKFLKKYDEAKADFIKNNIKNEQITKDVQNYNICLNTNIIKEKIIIEYEKEKNLFEIESKIVMELNEDLNFNNYLSDTSLD